MSYTPPVGSSTQLNFTTNWPEYNASAFVIEFVDGTNLGTVQLASVGRGDVIPPPYILLQRPPIRVTNTGISSFIPTSHLIELDIPKIKPLGFTTTTVGRPSLSWDLFVYPAGLATTSDAVYNHFIGDRYLYFPPYGGTLNLNFEGAYVQPPSTTINLEFVQTGAVTISSVTLGSLEEHGTHYIRTADSIEVPGYDFGNVGDHVVRSSKQHIYPFGVPYYNFNPGGPEVIYGAHIIAPGGIRPLPQTGLPKDVRISNNHWISFKDRQLEAFSVEPTMDSISEDHLVAFEYQYVEQAGRGYFGETIPQHKIEFLNRGITTPWIASMIFGTPNVGRVHYVTPSSWDSFSPPIDITIYIDASFVRVGVIEFTQYGEPNVRNEFQIVEPEDWQSSSITPAIIYNSRQYVTVKPYKNTEFAPDEWPRYYPFVSNRDRLLGVSGWASSKFQPMYPFIKNAAHQILPEHFGEFVTGDNLVTHRVRRLELPSIVDNPPISRYNIVFNDAFEVIPEGWDSSEFGHPNPVKGLRQWALHFDAYEGPQIGTAFIAYAVRGLTQAYTHTPHIPWPEVRFNPYPISPDGIEPPFVPSPDVEERFTIIHPSSANVPPKPFIGSHVFRNRNRNVYSYPYDMSYYGKPDVQLYTRYILPEPMDTIWGRTTIADRRLFIGPHRFSEHIIPETHQVRNELPDPPATRTILVWGYKGNTREPEVFGQIQLSVRSIFVHRYRDTGSVGQHTVRTNVIEIERGIFNMTQVGNPFISTDQFVYPKMIPWPNSDADPKGSSDFSFVDDRKPFQLSPHTIYGPEGDQATRQARHNHPPGYGQKMDYPHYGDNLGWATISNYHRRIGPVPLHVAGGTRSLAKTAVIGNPTLYLRMQYVHVPSIPCLRFGLTTIPTTPRIVDLDIMDLGFDSVVMGLGHRVGFPGLTPGDAVIGGFQSSRVSYQHLVEHRNRTIFVEGIDHHAVKHLGEGHIGGKDNPYGTPMMGWEREFRIGGGDITVWGNTWISNYIRELPLQGFDSSEIRGYSYGTFDDRLRVTREGDDGVQPTDPQGDVSPFSILPTTEFGDAMVAEGNRSVYLRGFRGGVGLNHSLSHRIVTSGSESSVVSPIDFWEEGKVKPVYYNESVVSTPSISTNIYPTPWYNFNGLTISIGVPYSIDQGVDTSSVSAPVFVTLGDCSRPVVSVSETTGESTVSVPGVAYA